ncbi:hypothetical protein L249_1206 [Ophiocordyceps polyrhachis-furcata BCC 54312]|uniref:BTB domain-containing protein n=1 Tax=Ophiocordyceps polyrhachis-furcata BCC 54312 TaxID=1330021 RepID=A0A367LFZ2_9HYPO|nr:hypothetical protein L249_1206 [Ophiocordyceps polyrhachis-furcata BCC 54312]
MDRKKGKKRPQQEDKVPSTSASNHGNEPSSSSSIHQALSRLLIDEKYSDLTIRCGRRHFNVHRAILCPQSTFFAKACDIGFKESLTQVIDLPEDDPYVLWCFLRYIYSGNYKDDEYHVFSTAASIAEGATLQAVGVQYEDKEEWRGELNDGTGRQDNEGHPQQTNQGNNNNNNLFLSLRVYVMADKFDVPGLKLLARDRFFETAADAYEAWEHFHAVMDEMCKTTVPTDVLRSRTCQLIAEKAVEKRSIPSSIEHVMAKHADVAVDILRRSLETRPNTRCQSCSYRGYF